MRKYLLSLTVLLAGVVSFTSCNEEDNSEPHGINFYSNGAYIVNAGNMPSNIDGSLTYINYANNNAVQKAFSNANNGESLGSTPNDGIVYGNKIYIVVDQSNTIEVLDKNTLKRVKQISTTSLLGDKEGNEPRHIIAANGYVYFTTYGGYVASVDTTSFNLKEKYQVGSYPEGLTAVSNGYNLYIYVANSDYGSGNGTISTIDLGNGGKVTTYTIKGINNPQKVFVSNSHIYVLDWGYYDDSWNQKDAGLKMITSETTSQNVVDCTLASLYNGTFYYINAAYGAGEVNYGKYDTSSASTSSWTPSEEVVSPCGIEVDPVTGDVFILSYQMGEYGYADYNADGYVNQYSNVGTKLHQYNTGVGPTAIFFETGYSFY